MFINPKTAISEGWITGIVDPDKQIQPNAIDFTVDQVFSIATGNAFVISEAGKVMRGGAPYPPVEELFSFFKGFIDPGLVFPQKNKKK